MKSQLFIKRRENRLSQKTLATMLNIHPTSYQLKESGKSDFTLSEAIKLSNYFKVSLDLLFGEKIEKETVQ